MFSYITFTDAVWQRLELIAFALYQISNELRLVSHNYCMWERTKTGLGVVTHRQANNCQTKALSLKLAILPEKDTGILRDIEPTNTE